MSPGSRTETRLQFVQKSIEFNKWQRAVTTEPIINTRNNPRRQSEQPPAAPGASLPEASHTSEATWTEDIPLAGPFGCPGSRNPLLALRLDKSSPNYTCLWAHPCLTPISQILVVFFFFFTESQFYAAKFTSTVYNLINFDRLHL